MVEVRLFAFFRDGRGKILHFPHVEGMIVDDLLKELGIGREEVSILLINGFHQVPETEVHEGDVVSLYPPVAGG